MLLIEERKGEAMEAGYNWKGTWQDWALVAITLIPFVVLIILFGIILF